MSDQKKESAMEEKRRVEQRSFDEEQYDIRSIYTSLEECECKKNDSECLIENYESFKEEQVEEKQDEIQKSEEINKEISLIIFEEGKREEMREICCDISSALNSLSSEEMNLFTNSTNHFLACFSPSVQNFEAQNIENEESLCYKLYKTIRFLLSISFLSFEELKTIVP
ncbi:hypothetical protein M9H77_30511 [Catharanthus roseus]|uniref:Uncharacterized protein n=1 Tax=Catharanthus roseus TaxID=4058 RepID=A0ACB9ZZH6_CATRO|nr:hypothetical protein M9H77_30511 [Catharanthus roseus]